MAHFEQGSPFDFFAVHFLEDEPVIMQREGGWIRVYRAHRNAGRMLRR
jgi:hypothetical protein